MKILTPNELSQLTPTQSLKYANRLAKWCMYGIVTKDEEVTIGDTIYSRVTISRFNRKALMGKKKKKKNNIAGDLSIIRTGKPGSKERIEAYRLWNECNNEVSPFMTTE